MVLRGTRKIKLIGGLISRRAFSFVIHMWAIHFLDKELSLTKYINNSPLKVCCTLCTKVMHWIIIIVLIPVEMWFTSMKPQENILLASWNYSPSKMILTSFSGSLNRKEFNLILILLLFGSSISGNFELIPQIYSECNRVVISNCLLHFVGYYTGCP